MLRALFYAYVLGGLTFIPLLIAAFIFITIYTSVPVGEPDVAQKSRERMVADSVEEEKASVQEVEPRPVDTNDIPRTRKAWLTMRRTFEETAGDAGYVTLVRSFLDSRSKDPKRSRPKDMWYVVLKGKVLYLYEDEGMTECEVAVELSSHQVVVYPEELPDAELFAKRNAICLKPKAPLQHNLPSVNKEMPQKEDGSTSQRQESQLLEAEKNPDATRGEAFDPSAPWFIFVRSNTEMEDWYISLVHASEHPSQTPTLTPLRSIFDPADMNFLVSTLDEQPDVIPMRWLNALLGRIFFSHYRTHNLEAYIIGRLMKKLSKVKRPAFLTGIVVTEVSVGNKAPMLSKPMLKELTKEGDASLEVHLQYKGEIRITVEATAVINLGARFKSYTVKLVLAAVLKELEGNLLIKVKRPPSNRIWYAFTQTPRMVLVVEPIVSDRQITWGMILSTIESKFKEIIQESVVMPNMDDIAFFETGQYDHRGGIWPDACRKPHEPTAVQTLVPDDVKSVASAPLPQTSVSPLLDPALPPTSQSAEDLHNNLPPSITANTTADPTSEDSDSSLNNARRHSCIPSVLNDDLDTSSAPTFTTETGSSNDSQNMRDHSSEVEITPTPTPQPQFSPGEAESVHSDILEPSEHQDEAQSWSELRPRSSRRSSSQYSFKSEPEVAPEEISSPRPKSTPNTPRKVSDTSHMARPPSPPSFFSTLKSKAGDKQAISNAAKEAVRKWGVNWGGFKKDSNIPTKTGDEASLSGSPPRSSLAPENNTSPTHKPRASYAEVRAAVAERKERDRAPGVEGEMSSTADKVARPISPLPDGSVYSETPINPSIVTSAARLTTPRLPSKKSTPSLSRVNTETDTSDLSATVEGVKHAPIHVQPQAKVMSIPGIHASHRGEVQSMGYVVPQSPPPSISPDIVLKNPAIQTVYRLWKTPSSQETAQTSGSPEETSPQDATDGDALSSVTPLTHLQASQTSTAKPMPPPLPPRSATPVTMARLDNDQRSAASRTLMDIAHKDNEHFRTQERRESTELPLPTPEVPLQQSSTAPADGSQAILEAPSLITNTRALLPSSNTPPPLPPRRIQTPA